MKCEKCKAEIFQVLANIFNRDGSDSNHLIDIQECDEEAVYFDANPNWCGAELDADEMSETIRCPKCHEFPFESKEIQTYQYVRVVMFKESTLERNTHTAQTA